MTAVDPTPYAQLPGLDGYYFEDSFVLSLRLGPDSIDFDLDAVLTPIHPQYEPPLQSEQHCYRSARLSFPNPRQFEFVSRGVVIPSLDAEGARDMGNIDALFRTGDRYQVSGEWGMLEIQSDPPAVTIELE